MLNLPPQILYGTYSDGEYHYSIKELILITKNNQIYEIPLETLLFNLHQTTWVDDVIPFDVIKNMEPEKEYQRILSVDLSYPILIYEEDNKYYVIDGMHRLCKAWMEGEKNILAKIVNNDQLTQAII